MFVLRRITPDMTEINTCLDSEYVLILKAESAKEFADMTESWSEEDLKEVYGLICFNDSDAIMPLYRSSCYYIMTGDGKTFSNLSPRGRKRPV